MLYKKTVKDLDEWNTFFAEYLSKTQGMLREDIIIPRVVTIIEVKKDRAFDIAEDSLDIYYALDPA